MSIITLPGLPSDVFVIILQYLTVKDLAILSRTCKAHHLLVNEFGWRDYLRTNSRPSHSLAKACSRWNPYAQVRYQTLADRAWSRREFVARPLSRPWHGKLQPLLAVSQSRLIVAAGSMLYSYFFTVPDRNNDAPGVQFESSYTLHDSQHPRRDVTGVSFVQDGGLDRTLYLGFEDGVLERVVLPYSKIGQQAVIIPPSLRWRRYQNPGDLVESVCSSDELLLSFSSGGLATLFDLSSSASPCANLIDLESRGWSSYLSNGRGAQFAAFGTSSKTPLVVHGITNAQFTPSPIAVLVPSEAAQLNSSAVYGISGMPQSSPWGASDRVLVSGWYDGVVRVHDLRDSTRVSVPSSDSSSAPLRSVLSLYDPWSFEPIYTVSCGGGASSHIAAGSARHSVVAFWDVRSPSRGWSVHAPGNDSSPVYSIVLESSRLFGATQSRPFVYDFGTGVNSNTYPRLPQNLDGVVRHKDWKGVGFYVTKYNHSRAVTDSDGMTRR
ncbi:hypothetical protein JAAARDRAFT_30380 [Jaapia argillacea MUCL 33604]|uniref:F-box domain-containing protein n=1 Tax=Jaapia argillacea MUCL 33604 TaxID=933084 RepID=A0A067QG62_9AGAM|nr:hypothetical protein JAAARDRAFT_30380 [Jaapia argillacea MUCL 33604]